MRSTAVRRTALAAAAASLVLLVSACGGEGSGGGTKDDTKGKESAAAEPAAKALTAAELEKVALAQGDVEGHKVAEAGPQDDIAAKDVTTDRAECKPFAEALSGVALGQPGATVKRSVVSEPAKTADPDKKLEDMTEEEVDDALAGAFDITATMTTLSSYADKGATEAVAELKAAATDCADGFTMTMDGTEQKILKMSEGKVTGGDEAVAWNVTAEHDGDQMPMSLAVVRKGGTTASFSSYNLAPVTDKKVGTVLPTAVIAAQAAKLG